MNGPSFFTVRGVAKLAVRPLTAIAYLASGLFGRNPSVWAFSCRGDKFSDNTKHLFIHITENCPDICAIWISSSRDTLQAVRSAGGRAYARWSPRGIMAATLAKYWFVTTTAAEVNYYLSRGASVVNLWHGIPLKKIYFDSDNPAERNRYNAPGILRKYVLEPYTYRLSDYVVTTAHQVATTSMASGLRVDLGRCLALGQPRCDVMLAERHVRRQIASRWDSPSLEALLERIPAFDRVWLYAPTWRESNPNFLVTAGVDFRRLDLRLQALNRLLLVKLHPYTPRPSRQLFDGLNNILLLDADTDLNLLMPELHGLVTDYSSVYIDFLVLDRPIIFFCFDLQWFLNECRGTYYDYLSVAPGVVTEDSDAFVEVLCGVGEDIHADDRKRVTRLFYDQVDGNSSARVVKHFASGERR